MTEQPAGIRLRRKDDGTRAVEIEHADDTARDAVAAHSNSETWDWMPNRHSNLTHWLVR
jgi:hypothetical protein